MYCSQAWHAMGPILLLLYPFNVSIKPFNSKYSLTWPDVMSSLDRVNKFSLFTIFIVILIIRVSFHWIPWKGDSDRVGQVFKKMCQKRPKLTKIWKNGFKIIDNMKRLSVPSFCALITRFFCFETFHYWVPQNVKNSYYK